MNKNGIAKAIHEAHGGLSFADAQRMVDLILDLIKDRLVHGEKVLLSRFGCFRVVKRRNRKGVNPQTKKAITILGRNAISFRPAKILKSV